MAALQITIIDFPQMVSVSHANAQEMFDRDVECIVRCACMGLHKAVRHGCVHLHGLQGC